MACKVVSSIYGQIIVNQVSSAVVDAIEEKVDNKVSMHLKIVFVAIFGSKIVFFCASSLSPSG